MLDGLSVPTVRHGLPSLQLAGVAQGRSPTIYCLLNFGE